MVELQWSEAETPVTMEQQRSNGRANGCGEYERWQWKRWRNDENAKWWKKKPTYPCLCALTDLVCSRCFIFLANSVQFANYKRHLPTSMKDFILLAIFRFVWISLNTKLHMGTPSKSTSYNMHMERQIFSVSHTSCWHLLSRYWTSIM